jgi:NAD(P)-dependent dehydrogenase (short-subunit alcohol dehydrogenase family)
VWVNVAMTAVLAELWDCTPEELLRVTQVTYLGSIHGIQAALRRFRPRDRGVIVQVGSALSRRGIPLQSSYCGAKHAVKGALDSLRAELIDEGSNVKVSLVQLPGHNTPQFDWVRTRLHKHPQPVPPIYQPEPFAEAVVHTFEHPVRELPIGWGAQKLLWGQKLSPRAGDLVLLRSGWSGQHTAEAKPVGSPDNLHRPLPGDRGARGRFSARSKASTLWTSLRLRRSVVAAAVAGAGLATMSVTNGRAKTPVRRP